MLSPRSPPLRNSYTVRFKVSVVEWQRKNKANIHKPLNISRSREGVVARENVHPAYKPPLSGGLY